jgi:GAF domain-containing protein
MYLPQEKSEHPLRRHDRRSCQASDLATVLKVSHAVSGEIVLEKLLDTLMRTALEHAGAARGLLILPRGDELRVEAEATIRGDTVTVWLRDASQAALPKSVLHYVVRTQESVILDDASAQNSFSMRTSVEPRRSVLCRGGGLAVGVWSGDRSSAS